jgi:hypothetical protein
MSRDIPWGLVPLFVVITAGYSVVCPATASAEEECLRVAWQAFNRKDYKAAIDSANVCIDEFGRAASREQAPLKNTPRPKKGMPSSAEEQAAIFQRGLLNDVGTAWFVKGRSAEHLSKGGREAAAYRKMAEESYKAACEYTHAMTWDPKKGFWSPCEASENRLPLPAGAGPSPQALNSKSLHVPHRHDRLDGRQDQEHAGKRPEHPAPRL